MKPLMKPCNTLGFLDLIIFLGTSFWVFHYLVFQPAEHLWLVLLLEGVRVSDENGHWVLHPVRHDCVFVLRVAERVLALGSKLVDPD